MLVNNFKNRPGSYAQKVKDCASAFKKMCEPAEREHYDYTPVRLKKRQDVAIGKISEAKRRLKGVCDENTIEAYFCLSNYLIMRGGYNDAADWNNEAALAAAIWILDQLSLQGKLEDCFPYLPDVSDGSFTSELSMCFPSHPTYDMELIVSMVMLIHRRNTSKHFPAMNRGTLQWDQGAPDSDEQSIKNRENYDAVIKLIDTEAISRAVKKYEEDIWTFYRLSFRAYSILENHIVKLERELYSKEKSSFDSPITKSSNVLSMSAKKNVPAFFSVNSADGRSTSQYVIKQREIEQLKNIMLTEFSLENDREKTVRKLKDILPADLSDDLIHFHVDDPYESAFALLYMLDTGSDIPWLYYGGISVAYTMADQFPFDTKEIIPGNPVLLSGMNSSLYEHKYSGYRWPDITDASLKPVKRTFANNYSQILYTNTSALFPRVIPEVTTLDSYLEGLGELTEREREAYTLLFYSISSSYLRLKTATLDSYRLEQEIMKDESEGIPEPDSDEDLTEFLKAENQRLRDKNSRLISALQELNGYKSSHSGELDTLKEIIERQKSELADLREKVFLLGQEEENEEPQESKIEYPYHTEGKILSFGGKDSWVNEMKKKLPDVLFISASTLPNEDLIRGADEIWIQINCISHSNYYKIMETLKSTEIQVRFYVYSGVSKCAQQIVESKQ